MNCSSKLSLYNYVVKASKTFTVILPIYGNKEKKMLETIAVILIVLWLLGLVTSYTLGGFIHILFVIAVVAILVRLIQGKRI